MRRPHAERPPFTPPRSTETGDKNCEPLRHRYDPTVRADAKMLWNGQWRPVTVEGDSVVRRVVIFDAQTAERLFDLPAPPEKVAMDGPVLVVGVHRFEPAEDNGGQLALLCQALRGPRAQSLSAPTPTSASADARLDEAVKKFAAGEISADTLARVEQAVRTSPNSASMSRAPSAPAHSTASTASPPSPPTSPKGRGTSTAVRVLALCVLAAVVGVSAYLIARPKQEPAPAPAVNLAVVRACEALQLFNEGITNGEYDVVDGSVEFARVARLFLEAGLDESAHDLADASANALGGVRIILSTGVIPRVLQRDCAD